MKINSIIVPEHLQEPIIRAYHECLTHPGVAVMYETIRAPLFWKGMETKILQFVQNCSSCTKNKHPTVKHGKLPTKTAVVRPWFEVAVDCIGPCGKNKFRAMTMIDTSTRLVGIQPVGDASSDDAAFVFDRCRYPSPLLLHAQVFSSPSYIWTIHLFDVKHTTNWDGQYQRKVALVAKNNERENAKRQSRTYAHKDKVLLRNDAGSIANMSPHLVVHTKS
ncbi:Rapid-growth-like protein 25 [Phytophthora palmivora]|uniref:Rapid-growth-like protein 25 n=1 Tax=Phytophthora palmivora TaxID=4796 RepID=A0A2P4WY55_9STRA|nr:Rapid-growth-like protein 25 [Phytophthora palmivora]